MQEPTPQLWLPAGIATRRVEWQEREFDVDERDRAGTDPTAGRVAHVLGLAHTALTLATAALAGTGPGAEEAMASLSGALAELRRAADDFGPADEAAPSPAGADIPSVLTGLYVGQDVGRIDLLIRQVADIAWARWSRQPLPGEVWLPVRDLGEACLRLIGRASDVVELSAPSVVMDSELADIGRRQRELGRLLLVRGASMATDDAIHAAVLGRCYEECGNRAVAVARLVGLLRETTAVR
ncbi:hypothetical protein [Streptomyces sp. NPDC090022]|uniref:hypothetical protein n=1 Tax=Streptomyces sp. NPDC090022 TaxID=3365920 RepID=UPI00380AB3CF